MKKNNDIWQIEKKIEGIKFHIACLIFMFVFVISAITIFFGFYFGFYIDSQLKDIPHKVCWNETDYENIHNNIIFIYDEYPVNACIIAKNHDEYIKCLTGNKFEITNEDEYLFKFDLEHMKKEVCEIK